MSTHCGTVSIAGRPNVGKSTLLNHLVGQKLSITAHKPQTTRHRIHGIKTEGELQVIYVDTPGIHTQGKRALNQVLNRTASTALYDVDLVLLLVQAGVWNKDDQRAYDLVVQTGVPFYIVINKVDLVKQKAELLPFIEKLPSHDNMQDVLIVSAKNGNGIDMLEKAVAKHMPEGEFHYGADELTDRSARFLAAESVREQLTRLLSAELPYSLSVDIEQYEQSADLIRIGAVIFVEKNSQKGIASMETLFDCKVFLQLWVRVKDGWADDERALRSLGYTPHE